jgi:hypothetical protein
MPLVQQAKNISVSGACQQVREYTELSEKGAENKAESKKGTIYNKIYLWYCIKLTE